MSLHTLPMSFVAASAVYTAPAAMATAVINENSLVPVGVAVLCSVFIGGLLWKAASVLQRIEDRLNQIDRDMAEMKRRCDQMHQ